MFYDIVQRLRTQGNSVFSTKLDSKTKALVGGISRLLDSSRMLTRDDILTALAIIQQAVNEIIAEVEDLPGVLSFLSFRLFFSS